MKHLSIILSIFFLSLYNVYAQDTIRERNIEFSLFPYSYNIPVGSFAKQPPNNIIEDYAKPYRGLSLGLSYRISSRITILGGVRVAGFDYDELLPSTINMLELKDIELSRYSFYGWRVGIKEIGENYELIK